MSAGFTPGPWVVRGCCVIAPNETNPYLAELSSPRGPDVRDADAQLIASAPDLLEALEGLVNAVGEHPIVSVDYADNIARAAIAKALGK